MNKSLALRPVSLAVAAVFAFGVAMTAFGVAPLPQTQLPAVQTVHEAIEFRYEVAAPVERVIQSDRVRRGDTVSSLAGRLGATDPEFTRFVATDKVARKLLRFQTGRIVQAEIDSTGLVQHFHYPLGADDSDPNNIITQRLTVRRNAAGAFEALEEQVAVTRNVEIRSVEITSSLFAATNDAGIPDSVASQVADILGGEIDFQRDVRVGDRLSIVYETLQEADSLEAPSAGRVLAVEMSNNGNFYDAFRFERNADDTGNYYSSDGKSLKKSFLRYPIEFARISSRFSATRVHPLFGTKRPHRGVDFAASTGTRVRVTGDGTVDFAGAIRGYGNVLKIRHPNNVTTVYAHLNGFVRGIHRGSRVHQGDVIAFVGQTGWATGPHLHYEFQVNGIQANPLKIALPSGRPLDADALARFKSLTAGYKTELARTEIAKVASFE